MMVTKRESVMVTKKVTNKIIPYCCLEAAGPTRVRTECLTSRACLCDVGVTHVER